MADEKIKITGLWKKKSKDGKVEYLSGNINVDEDIQIGQGHRLLVFKNKYKEEGDQRPDYNAYVALPNDEPQHDEPQQEEVPF